MPISGKIPRPSTIQRCVLAAALLLASVAAWSVTPTSAAPADYRVDLKVLLLDDDSAWVDAIENQMTIEGVPFTRIDYDSHAAITAASLSSGDRAFYQAVVGPDAGLGLLTGAERTALRSFEAKFGVREVDAYNFPTAAVGLQPSGFIGDLDGTTATVTAAGKAGGFGFLNGPVPFSIGSYSYLAQPLPPASLPAGASFTTLVSGQKDAVTGSLLGVYSSGGVEQMIITAAFNQSLPQFNTLAHGIISWMTRGVHFGYNRNNFTMHVDDAFAEDAIWNSQFNCTPGEDCPTMVPPIPEVSVRMVPADVTYAAAWETANNYTLTIPFNGFYADNTTTDGDPVDPLTVSFVNNRNAFRWLNHGYEHIYQGCVQNFAVFPWACTDDPAVVPQTVPPTPLWVSQAAIYNEIHNNITKGQALNLPFDATEYLSGEHSGMFLLPQQPLDNPNFIAALNQAPAIKYIGSDASRDPDTRMVGGATTIPRHPTALYYNTSTMAEAVDEYSWIYTTVAQGGSGICGTTSPPCLTAPLTLPTDFLNYIVPTDAAFNMNFILGNDPRPFYAHVTNMTGDRLLYPLLEKILTTYRAAFTPATPLKNLTLTEAATALSRQSKWTATGSAAVTGYVQSGNISVTNGTGQMVPITAPAGSTINGATLEAYGGEVSGWLTAGNKTGTIAPAVYATTGSPAFTVGVAGAVGATATATPTASMFVTGNLPAGLTMTTTPTTVSVTGTPAAGTAGPYTQTVRVVSAAGTTTQTINIVVSNPIPPTTTTAPPTTTTAPPTTTTAPPTGNPPPAPGTDHVALTPARLADTRTGGTTVDGLFAGTGIQQRGSTMELQVGSRGGVSADAAAAVLNVTVADATGGGFVTVYPCGEAQPTASNLNFVAGSIVPNAVIAKIGAGGKVCLFVSNDTQLVVDVNGYFPATTTLHSINPARVLDTRGGYTTIDGLQQGAGMSAGGTSTPVQITNRASVPADASAVVLNVTVTEAQQAGFVAVYPCGTAVPTASNINYLTGSTVANLVVSKIGADGNVCIFTNSTTHLVVDVDGYFPATTSYTALDPARLLDTRPGFSTIDGQFVGADIRPAGTITELTVTNRGGVPAGATTVVLNVTSTDATQSGFLTVYPCGVDTPLASNLNYTASTTAAVAVLAKVGADGKVCILNSGATQIVADVNGYIVN